MGLFGDLFFGVKRRPVPELLVDEAIIPGLPRSIRVWGDVREHDITERASQVARELENAGASDTCVRWLALSGGGPQGAFGAGILNGWTEAGDRPTFQRVTGVSTGALMAPFAYLGSEWDDQLAEIYTYPTRALLKKRRLVTALLSDAAADSAPLAGVIAKYANTNMLEAISREHGKGRRLWIGTTNIDAMRPVLWGLSDVAASGHAEALDLFRKVVLASASIPGAFPPVRFHVEAGGQPYDELHVDGGTTTQVFAYPIRTDMKQTLAEVGRTAQLYVIRNARLDAQWKAVEPRALTLAGRSIGSLLRVQGFGDLYRIFLATQRDGIDFNLTYIPSDFTARPKETFDVVYMKELYDVGYQMAKSGAAWQKSPPGYSV